MNTLCDHEWSCPSSFICPPLTRSWSRSCSAGTRPSCSPTSRRRLNPRRLPRKESGVEFFFLTRKTNHLPNHTFKGFSKFSLYLNINSQESTPGVHLIHLKCTFLYPPADSCHSQKPLSVDHHAGFLFKISSSIDQIFRFTAVVIVR